MILRRDDRHTMTANKRRGPTDGRTDGQTDGHRFQSAAGQHGWLSRLVSFDNAVVELRRRSALSADNRPRFVSHFICRARRTRVISACHLCMALLCDGAKRRTARITELPGAIISRHRRHSMDAAYCYRQRGVVCVSGSALEKILTGTNSDTT